MTDLKLEDQTTIDLETARSKAQFDVSKLSDFMYNGPERRQFKEKVSEVLVKEPLFNKTEKLYMNREQLLDRAMNVQSRLLEMREELDWGAPEFMEAVQLLDDAYPFTLHFGAFLPVIMSQASDEQQEEWLPKCMDFSMTGCYCQTELGHGSNVQQLETIATYIPESDEIEIHSPSITATKWWAGGLGVLATHAVVQAILHVEGKSRGPHLFIVPLRSLKDHTPLKGVLVGDIGPKSYGGFASIDNGFAKFTHVRIPRYNMLARHAQITKEGKYVPPPHAKLSYGSMVALRAVMPQRDGWALARATTIAARYCTCRRQFGNTNGAETQVINYASVRYRLFPLIAKSISFVIAGGEVQRLYQKMLKQLTQKGDTSGLAEVHSLTSGMKAICSWDACQGLEEARKSMGGHGFSAYSGVGAIFAQMVAGQTYEGDNYVIVQQTAKAQMKHLNNLANAQLPPSSQYLYLLKEGGNNQKKCQVAKAEDWCRKEEILQALGYRAAKRVQALANISSGRKWEELNMECARLTRAHAENYIAAANYDSLARADGAVKGILEIIFTLASLDTLVKALPDLFEDGYITPVQATQLRQVYDERIHSFAIHAIPVTESFAFTDYELDSALGASDGRVYQRLFESARANPLNKDPKRWVEGVRKLTQGGRSVL